VLQEEPAEPTIQERGVSNSGPHKRITCILDGLMIAM